MTMLRTGLFALTLLISTIFAVGQGTIEDYRRADSASVLFGNKMYYGNVRPAWIAESSVFTYENITPKGREYIIVDPVKKTKGEAFDQIRFAKSFESVTGRKAVPGKLPIRNIVFPTNAERFTFEYENMRYTCTLKNYTITRGDSVRLPSTRRTGTDWAWGSTNELSNRPVTSPDKKWTAYIQDYNVYIKSVEANKVFKLSHDGGLGEYYSSFIRWSPDSKKLMTTKVRPAEKQMIHYVESSPSTQLQPKYTTYEYTKPGDALNQYSPQLFHVETKAQVKVDDAKIKNHYSLTSYRWADDSKSFSFEYNKRGHQVYQIIEVDAATGELKIIVNETSPTFIDYSGKKYRFDLKETNELIWASERDGWNHLYLYDTQKGLVKNQITRGEWIVRSVLHVDDKARQITFQASGKEAGDPYLIDVYRINFDGTGIKRLTDGAGTHEVFFSPDRAYFVDTWSRADLPPVAVLRKTSDGSLVLELEKADISELLKTGWQMPEVFSSKGRDGKTDIWGLIVRPSNFDPAKKYPVIEYIYAGPHSNHVPKTFRAYNGNMNPVAELGFILVQIDGMGTSNRSKAFHDVCWKDLKDAGFPDRILWMKDAASKYKYMDITRVGIFGTSAGGQNSAGAVLFHPEFYKVAVSSCGCHDNRMDKIWWNEAWMGWPVGIEYAQSSNTENAYRLKGKLLLINGELDANVDPASTTQFVNALIKAKKDFDYLLVPGMGHSGGGDYGERRRRDYFVQHLLGVTPPDWNRLEK
jgi:dipeptidyl aminopeptidase/acylaminoacyl peptidase